MIRRAIILSSVVALTACSTYSLEELRHTTPQGSRFQNALAKYYMDFAGQEEKEYDWRDSWYFADKGLRAIYGKDTAPEVLADWEIPEAVLPELQQASLDLTRVLTEENMKRQPDAAAKAQFFFDCWIEQQEENWQSDDIEYCKSEFNTAMSMLDIHPVKHEKKKSKPKAKTEAPAPVAAPVKAEAPAKSKAKKPVDKLFEAKEPAKQEAKPVEEKKPEVKHEEPTPAPKAEPEEVKQPEAAAPKEAAPKEAPTVAATSSFVIFFDSGEAVVTTPADGILLDAIKSVKGKDNYEVKLTNKSKKGDANLTKERMNAISKRLVEGGVKISSINTGGEATPATVNHKVEIFIND